MTVELVFLIAGMIVILAFICNLIFHTFGLPDTIFLISFGILLGPLLNLFSYESLLVVAPYLTVLTLIIVLFNAGLTMDIGKVLARSPRAFALSILYVIFCTIAVALITRLLFNWHLIYGIMLACMLAGTSSVVIIPLVSKLGIEEETSLTLSIESSMTDVLNIIIFFACLQAYFVAMPSLGEIFIDIVSSYSIAITFGFLFGIIWLVLLHYLSKKEYVYMLIMGTLFCLYFFIEALGGSGAISSLIFGLVLGNDRTFIKSFKIEIQPLTGKFKEFLGKFQSELSFLMRAFFFVFIGLMYKFSIEGLLLGCLFVLICLGARNIATWISTLKSSMAKRRNFMTFMCGQGLAHAALAIIPLQYVNRGFPYEIASLYILIIVNVILLTNIITFISAYLTRKRVKRVNVTLKS